MPFLAIDPGMRAKVIWEAFTPRAGSAAMLDHTAKFQALSYNCEYSLAPDWQDGLDSAVEERREALDMGHRDQGLRQVEAD